MLTVRFTGSVVENRPQRNQARALERQPGEAVGAD
jgi:hypothetical protein